jgi:hypothetical protein
VPSHHLVGDYTDAPPVYCLQQFELGVSAAISHFNFFTHSHIFTRVSTNRKCVVWTNCDVHFLLPSLYGTFLCLISTLSSLSISFRCRFDSNQPETVLSFLMIFLANARWEI